MYQALNAKMARTHTANCIDQESSFGQVMNGKWSDDGVMMESNAAQYVHPATVDSVMWMEALENFTYFYQYFTLEDETIYSADYEDMEIGRAHV